MFFVALEELLLVRNVHFRVLPDSSVLDFLLVFIHVFIHLLTHLYVFINLVFIYH